MKLERKHLITYLLYNVQCSYLEDASDKKRIKATLTGISLSDGVETTYKRKRKGCSGDLIGFEGHNNIQDLKFKLHLHPMSDLTKEIEVNGEKTTLMKEMYILFGGGFKKYEYFEKDCMHIYNQPLKFVSFETIQLYLEHHFDVFSLIPEGLAIDINKIK